MDDKNKIIMIDGRKHGKLTLVKWLIKKSTTDQKATDVKRW